MSVLFFFFFFFNDTATTEIYTLSLHDALPISASPLSSWSPPALSARRGARYWPTAGRLMSRPGHGLSVLLSVSVALRPPQHRVRSGDEAGAEGRAPSDLVRADLLDEAGWLRGSLSQDPFRGDEAAG